jgi:hypothetical protein
VGNSDDVVGRRALVSSSSSIIDDKSSNAIGRVTIRGYFVGERPGNTFCDSAGGKRIGNIDQCSAGGESDSAAVHTGAAE